MNASRFKIRADALEQAKEAIAEFPDIRLLLDMMRRIASGYPISIVGSVQNTAKTTNRVSFSVSRIFELLYFQSSRLNLDDIAKTSVESRN